MYVTPSHLARGLKGKYFKDKERGRARRGGGRGGRERGGGEGERDRQTPPNA